MKKLGLFLLVALLIVPSLAVEADNNQQDMEITLQFAATVGEEMVACGTNYEGVGAGEADVEITDFRFYVYDIMLMDSEGNAVPLQLTQDGLWQFENVALLDFEDGTGRCDFGTPSLNGTVDGTAPTADYVGVEFKLGVPFALNHAEPTSSPSPLNLPSLWWNWQIGYKFIRIDLITDVNEEEGWNIHLGSTGCTSPASVMAPQEECSRPNIAVVTLDEFDLENDVIVADLSTLLTNIDLSQNTPSPSGCQAGFDDPDCPALMANFGLSVEEGACADGDCSTQTFFYRASREEVPLIEDVDMMMDMDGSDAMDMSGESHNQHSN